MQQYPTPANNFKVNCDANLSIERFRGTG